MDMENTNGLGEDVQFDEIYNNLFRCIYNKPLVFPSDDGDSTILHATAILQASCFLDARDAVRMSIETHLLRLNQFLWFNVYQRPEGWASLGCRLQSPLIFREAMLHIVGKFNWKEDGIDKKFLYQLDYGIDIYELAVKKAKELKDKCLRVERRLMEFFPDKMIHKEDSLNMTLPGRAIYASDVYLWQALILIRQYFASAYIANLHHRAPDGGISFYRTVEQPDTYLRADTLLRFHECFDMSAKGRTCLLSAIREVKESVKPIVGELLVDLSQATRGGAGSSARGAAGGANGNGKWKYLTCTEVMEDEFPWKGEMDKGIDPDLAAFGGVRG